MSERWVLEHLEIGGVPVPRGAELGLLFGSAHRDPEVSADPDRLDLGRHPDPHVSFGAGTHVCLGVVLARLGPQTSLATVLRRLPRLELLEEPVWRPGDVLRGLQALHVHVGAACRRRSAGRPPVPLGPGSSPCATDRQRGVADAGGSPVGGWPSVPA